MGKVSQRSARSGSPEKGWADAVDDIGSLMRTVNALDAKPIWLSGPRVICPEAGNVTCYIVTRTATLVSTGANNHTIGVYRNGQPLTTALPMVTWNGSAASEIPAFQMRLVGESRVAAGDEIRPYITVAGSPSPTLTVDDLTVLLALER